LQPSPQSQLPPLHEHEVKFGPPPQRHRQLAALDVQASPQRVSLAPGQSEPLQLSWVSQVHTPETHAQLPLRQPASKLQLGSLLQALPCAS
jgi:hypothetical protein